MAGQLRVFIYVKKLLLFDYHVQFDYKQNYIFKRI